MDVWYPAFSPRPHRLLRGAMTLWSNPDLCVLELDDPEIELVIVPDAEGTTTACWVDSQTGGLLAIVLVGIG